MSYGQYSSEHRQSIPARPDLTQRQSKTPKREKHIFGSGDTGIEHVWANPLDKDGSGYYQTHATNPQRNFYFKTELDAMRVLYSYRDTYPIASLFDIGKGKKRKRVYLVRSGTPYSVTTSGHINCAWRAIPDKSNAFEVPYVTRHDNLGDAKYGNAWTRDGKPDKTTHKANLADIVTRLTDEIGKLQRARSTYQMKYSHAGACELRAIAKRYARIFKLKLPKLPTVPAIDKAKFAKWEAWESERTARAEALAKRKREEWEAHHASEVAVWEASGYCKHTPHHTLGEQRECERQTEHEDWLAHKTERIAQWKRGEDVTLRTSYQDESMRYALLRVVQGDGAYVVETSMSVSVPVSGLAGAARLLRVLQSLRKAGKTYHTNGHKEHIGNFVVTSFALNADGEYVLIAGCHTIQWSEIETIIPQLIDAEALEAQQGLQA